MHACVARTQFDEFIQIGSCALEMQGPHACMLYSLTCTLAGAELEVSVRVLFGSSRHQHNCSSASPLPSAIASCVTGVWCPVLDSAVQRARPWAHGKHHRRLSRLHAGGPLVVVCVGVRVGA